VSAGQQYCIEQMARILCDAYQEHVVDAGDDNGNVIESGGDDGNVIDTDDSEGDDES
jgi:hypothetical protein